MKNDDTKIVKSRMSGFSRGRLKVHMRCLGTSVDIGRRLLLVCFEGLASHSGRVLKRFVCGSREICLVPSLHRVSTDALIHREGRKDSLG